MQDPVKIIDAKMFELLDILLKSGHIRYKTDFCDAVGIVKQNLRNIRIGRQHFALVHVQKACMIYGVNANWLMGLETVTFRRVQTVTKTLTKTLIADTVEKGKVRIMNR